ncbi:hypothetical protein [Candidatus Soleaferrea massiliensis]|uniref:hypothetical protein n=1 Tax=Candidatus Soleaferrea massiliensis TaxID=1470354 RepID=UPI00058D1776|nr:hypothetical protein [Candidatus Soleaferrea massiliensis]
MNGANKKGAVTLEACVSVLLFLVLMLLLSSVFVIFMAQNATAHALLQTSESLSLDVHSTEKFYVDGIGTLEQKFGELINKLCGSAKKNPYFVSNDKWYTKGNAEVASAAKNRFIGFITGGDSDGIAATDAADKYLKNLNIVNGIEGVNFSSSFVAQDTLYVVLEYELEYDFNIWNLGTIEVKQRTCSKLWK